MFEVILEVTGAITLAVLIYYFFLRHVMAGLCDAGRVCYWLIRVDFDKPDIAANYSEWDKLWLVPKVFVFRFLKGFKNSLDWG